MGARNRMRARPLSRAVLDYYANKQSRDGWETVWGEISKRRAEGEKDAAAFWMAVLKGEADERDADTAGY